ncbi:MAG TPA: hypothetical protein VK612_02045 [Pyrinomonadaceae bacterium]|nr:hypothetical protein [Pyrinomonadaceae bacterium]
MITDAEIKNKGIKALLGAMGPKEADRFLTLLDRRPADYTEWRHLLFEGLTVDEINDEASKLWNEKHPTDVVS